MGLRCSSQEVSSLNYWRLTKEEKIVRLIRCHLHQTPSSPMSKHDLSQVQASVGTLTWLLWVRSQTTQSAAYITTSTLERWAGRSKCWVMLN